MSEFFKDEKGQEIQVKLEGDDIPEPFRGKDMKTSLTEAAEKVKAAEELEVKAKALEAKVVELEKGKTPPTEPVKKSDAELAKEVAEKFEDDPRGTILGLVDERLKPLIEEQTATNMETTLTLLKKDSQEFPEFDKYEGQVREKLQTIPPDLRGRKEVIKTFYDLVRVKDLESFKNKVESGEYKPETVEAPGGQLPPSSKMPRKTENIPLSVDEQKQMKIWGFKDEKEFRTWQSADASEGEPLAKAREEREKSAASAASLRR